MQRSSRASAVVKSVSGEALLHELFEPLGYEVRAVRHPLDPQFPEWGASPYFTLTVSGEVRLRDLLSHLYVVVLADWAGEVAARFGYGVRFLPVGPEDSELGAPTQMAVFER